MSDGRRKPRLGCRVTLPATALCATVGLAAVTYFSQRARRHVPAVDAAAPLVSSFHLEWFRKSEPVWESQPFITLDRIEEIRAALGQVTAGCQDQETPGKDRLIEALIRVLRRLSGRDVSDFSATLAPFERLRVDSASDRIVHHVFESIVRGNMPAGASAGQILDLLYANAPRGAGNLQAVSTTAVLCVRRGTRKSDIERHAPNWKVFNSTAPTTWGYERELSQFPWVGSYVFACPQLSEPDESLREVLLRDQAAWVSDVFLLVRTTTQETFPVNISLYYSTRLGEWNIASVTHYYARPIFLPF